MSKQELDRQKNALNLANQRLTELQEKMQMLEEKLSTKNKHQLGAHRIQSTKNKAPAWNNNKCLLPKFTRGLLGLHAHKIEVEVHISSGLPSLTIVGLPEAAVRESKDRVRSAIINGGFNFQPNV